MLSRYRLTIFFSVFGAAAVALLFVLVTTEDPLSAEHRAQLLAITALGLGGAVVAAFLVASLLAAPVERRVADIIAVARRYAVGDLQRPLPDYGDDELGDVARAMDQAIHELGRRVDDLSRDRTRMVAFLSSMVDGVLVVDDNGRLQLVNDAARRMLNLHHDAVNHSYLQAIRHPGIVDQLTRVLSGETPSGLELTVT
jgi:signal transduction histidine kinase